MPRQGPSEKKWDYKNMAQNTQSEREIKYVIMADIYTDILTPIKKQMLTKKTTL